ncbi:MAG: phosphotransferase [Pseudomonadota bacterium]
MPSPHALSFLARHGLAGANLTPLATDCSTRRYFRVPDSGLLLMDDHADISSFEAFTRVARHLRALGVSAPYIHGSDTAAGLALIEDFGTLTYSVCLDSNTSEAMLYEFAVDALLEIQTHPDAANISLPAFDIALLIEELHVFTEWFAPEFLSGTDLKRFEVEILDLWKEALDMAPVGHKSLVLRDFHVDNLMLLESREGVQRCGLLDFQDALIGPIEYDLVSLLQDARRDLSPGLETQLLARYLSKQATSSTGEQDFLKRYYILGAQRHARIAGLFVRLCKRDAKPSYLNHLPRVIGQLQQALSDAQLTNISAHLDAHLSGWRNAGDWLTADYLMDKHRPA